MPVMMRGMATMVAVLLAGGSVGLGVRAAPAPPNPSCSNTDVEFVDQTWTRSLNDVLGVRAPIDLRTNGVVCATDGTSSSWIGIQNAAGDQLTQIGFLHYYDTSLQTGVFCKFWENVPNPPQEYDCGITNNDTNTYFEIEQYISESEALYAIDDCGSSGGYGSCTLENGNEAAFSSPFGVAAAEIHGACDSYMMGSESDPERYGTDSYPLEGDVPNGWAERTWSSVQYPTSPACAVSDYSGDAFSQGFRSWDIRTDPGSDPNGNG
jgi:hypothetical protein